MENGSSDRSFDRVCEVLAGLDPSGIRDVLELGCGSGRMAARIAAEYPFRVLAVDADPARVEAARRRYAGRPRLRFRVDDATALSLDDGGFDLVVSRAAFPHLPAWERAIDEIARVLRPGGHLVWLDLALPRRFQVLLRVWRHRAGLYTAEEMRAAVADGDAGEIHYRRIVRAPQADRLVLVKQPRAA